ncbi:MAG: hypothetical protein KIS68_14800 [Bauldia sp.]|nr:hypothetical protein [Bauldia sp.]
MSSSQFDDDEKPLDPAMLRVQKRLRRLMVIGGSTLALGIAAVMFAIVYRFFIQQPSSVGAETTLFATVPMGEVSAESVGLPAGAELLSTNVTGTVMTLAFRDGNDLVTVLVDTTTMRVSGQFRIAGGAAAPAPP